MVLNPLGTLDPRYGISWMIIWELKLIFNLLRNLYSKSTLRIYSNIFTYVNILFYPYTLFYLIATQLRSTKEERFLIFWVACYRVGSLCTQAKADPCFFVPWFTFSAPFWMTSQFQALSFCLVLRCLSDVLEGSSFIILPRASLFVGRVGRFKLYFVHYVLLLLII